MSKRKQLNRALLDAVLSGQLTTVVALLDQGADIEARDREHGETPLMLSLLKPHIHIVSALIQRGANVNVQDHQGMTPLMSATRSASLASMRLLLEHGADCSVLDANEEGALMYAVTSADPEIVHFLIQYQPCLGSASIQRARERARSWGLTEIVEMLSAAETR